MRQIDEFARPRRIHRQRFFRIDVLAGIQAALADLVMTRGIGQV